MDAAGQRPLGRPARDKVTLTLGNSRTGGSPPDDSPRSHSCLFLNGFTVLQYFTLHHIWDFSAVTAYVISSTRKMTLQLHYGTTRPS